MLKPPITFDKRYQLEPSYKSLFRENNDRYSPQYENIVRIMSDKAKAKMSDLGDQFSNFLDRLDNSTNIVKPTIIITSDHGKIYGKGRIWKTYHPNEEVIKVLFAIINGARIGIDLRYYSTPDVSASILDFFGIDKDINTYKSVFGDNKGHAYVTTLTNNAQKRKEWYLVISGRPEGKYQINIHPEGEGEINLIKVHNYNEIQISEIEVIPENIKLIISESVKNFGLRPKNIHRRYEKILKENLN